MKCRDFQRMLADWVRGRLPNDNAEQMTNHTAECRSCADEAEMERSLRQTFQLVPPITRTPDLWERIEARVETAQRPRFAFRFQRFFALSGALAAGILAVALFPLKTPVTSPGTSPRTVVLNEGDPASGEPGVLEKINAIRMLDQEPAGTWTETPLSSDAARRVLLVGSNR